MKLYRRRKRYPRRLIGKYNLNGKRIHIRQGQSTTVNGSDASAMAKDHNSGLMVRFILGNGEMARFKA